MDSVCGIDSTLGSDRGWIYSWLVEASLLMQETVTKLMKTACSLTLSVDQERMKARVVNLEPKMFVVADVRCRWAWLQCLLTLVCHTRFTYQRRWSSRIAVDGLGCWF